MKQISLIVFFITVILKSIFTQIVVFEQTGFIQSSRGDEFGSLEDVSTPDNGGVAYFFVSNENTTQSDRIIDVKFHVAGTYYTPAGIRIWPPVMEPKGSGNSISTVTVKGLTSPFKEGHAVTIEVTTENGHYFVLPYTQFITPDIRIGNLIISKNNQDLYVFLRNTSTSNSYNIEEIFLNENYYLVGNSSSIEIIGNNSIIQPKQILIIKIINPFELYPNKPVALRIKTINTATSDVKWASAGVRLTETVFPLGTWESSLFDVDKEFARKKLRKLSLNSVHGPSDPVKMQNAYNEYFIRTIWEPNFGDPANPQNAIPWIQGSAGKEYLELWSIDDEPDLHSKPLDEVLMKNQTYWDNDPYTPSYVNLCTQRKYQRYGWMADVVSMDHYSAADAPNVIPMTWTPVVGRTGKISEAIEYTEFLKNNLEPRRMHSWCQLASGVWNVQPRDYSVNYQFWAHVMCGAKGIHWFTAKSNTDTNYAEQWNEAIKLTNQFNQIKNLCLWSESANIVTASTSNVRTRALVGEDAMIVVVLNNKITFSYNALQMKWTSGIDDVNYWAEFTVPDWIPIEEIYRVTADGKVTNNGVQHLGGRTYRIDTPDNIYKESHVFVIGKVDNIPPDQIEQIVISDNPDLNNYTFSWKEPYDNFGVMGYKLYRNGNLYADVRHPIYEVINGPSICEQATWHIIAYDNSGNESTPAYYYISEPETPNSVQISPSEACPNANVILTVSGGNTGSGGEWKWYKNFCGTDAGGVLIGTGQTISILPEANVTYFVRAESFCGSSDCLQFSVPFAQAPVDSEISASEYTICLGQTVTINANGGTGDPVYFCSDNGGQSWNIFSLAYEGHYSFDFTPQSEGQYIIHVKNRNHCGFCWDFGSQYCTTFNAVTINVLPAFSATMTRIPTGPQCTGTFYTFYAHPSGGSGNYTYQWYVNDELQATTNDYLEITLTNPNPYAITHYVRVEVSDGACTTSAQMTPTVLPLPAAAGNIIGEQNFCRGLNTFNYSVPTIEGAIQYLWTIPQNAQGNSNSNSIDITFDENFESGYISVTGVNSCGEGQSSSILINSIPIPETPVISLIDDYLISNYEYGNQWYLQNNIIDGASNQILYPTEDGEYYVIVSLNGCNSEPSNIINYIYSNIVNSNLLYLKIYPNPAKDFIIVESSDNKNWEITIYNSLGQSVFESSLKNNLIIDISGFASGVYYISIKNENNISYEKIIKN